MMATDTNKLDRFSTVQKRSRFFDQLPLRNRNLIWQHARHVESNNREGEGESSDAEKYSEN